MSYVSETSTSDVCNTSTYDKNNYSVKPPSFNGEATQFLGEKTKFVVTS